MLDQTTVPKKEDESDPLMVTLSRDGKEVMAETADDGQDAVRVGCMILLGQRELKIGDELRITRI